MSPGFKQTEVGVIPEDWDTAPLSELCSSICDGTHFTPRYVAHGVPFYSVENVTANDFANTRFISEVDHKVLAKRCNPERGDILMTRIGSLGDTRLLDWDVNASVYVSLALLKPNERIDSNYLYAYSKSRAFVSDVEKRSLLNAAPKKINMGEIGAIPIPFPASTREQEAIATALSDADALIGSLEQLLAKKRQLKQGAMQELLTGTKRLRGFEIKAGFRQTEAGIIPEDWGVTTVGDEFSVQLGKMLDSEKNVGLPKPFVGNRAIQWGRIDLSDIGLVRLTPSDLQRFRLQRGDLLVCEGGEVGRCAIWQGTLEECYFQKALHRLRPKRGYHVALMSHILRRLAASGILSNFVTQTSIAHLPKDKFETVPIPLPSKAEQKAIAAILSDIESGIAALEAKLAKVRHIKQGMTQELLTGRIRLPLAQIAATV